jgi:zinc transport system ATP-binding protein
LTCSGLLVGFGGRPLLPPIDLTIRRGQVLAVLGRNGAGKSTWMRTVLGLLRPLGGRVRPAPGLRISYVPQAASLDDILPMTGRDVVLWGRLRGWGFLSPVSSGADRAAAAAALEAAEAVDFSHRPYRDLSRGQKQRILFARAIASGAELLLLDEPTAAMDTVAQRNALMKLVGLARERSLGIAIVAHDLMVAREFADRALFMDRDDGAVVEGPTAEVFAHPAFRRRYGLGEPARG